MNQYLTSPLRVVVIDGNELERDATIALCRQCGLLVNGWSHSGAAGLVILDLQLPDMDGANLLLALSMLAPQPAS